MIIDSDELASRVAPHGIVRLYPNTGRYDFSGSASLSRSALLCGEDDSIRPSLRACCDRLADTDAVAAAAAGHLAECGVTPLYLVPQVHWEHEMLDHCPQVWRRVLARVGQRWDDPGLTGGNAVVLLPGQTPLARMMAELLRGISQSGVTLLADRPLIVKIHQHRQVWFCSTDTDLLPIKRVARG